MNRKLTVFLALVLALALPMGVFAAGSKTTLTAVAAVEDPNSTAKVLSIATGANTEVAAEGTTAAAQVSEAAKQEAASVVADQKTAIEEAKAEAAAAGKSEDEAMVKLSDGTEVTVADATAAEGTGFEVSEDTAAVMLDAGYTKEEVVKEVENANKAAASIKKNEKDVVVAVLNTIKSEGVEKVFAKAIEAIGAEAVAEMVDTSAVSGETNAAGNGIAAVGDADKVDTSDYTVNVISTMNVIPDPNNMPSIDNPIKVAMEIGGDIELTAGQVLQGMHFLGSTNTWEAAATEISEDGTTATVTLTECSPVALVVIENTKIAEAVKAAVAPETTETQPEEAAKKSAAGPLAGLAAVIAAVGVALGRKKKTN